MIINLNELKKLLDSDEKLEDYTISINKKEAPTIHISSEPLVIYTDGAYKPSTDQGGWAMITNTGYINWYGEKHTTNNRMEIKGVLEALKYLHSLGKTTASIYSDSQYVIGTITKAWKRNKNIDLWDEFDKLSKGLNISYFWVKGHADNKYNNMADEYAVKGSELLII